MHDISLQIWQIYIVSASLFDFNFLIPKMTKMTWNDRFCSQVLSDQSARKVVKRLNNFNIEDILSPYENCKLYETWFREQYDKTPKVGWMDRSPANYVLYEMVSATGACKIQNPVIIVHHNLVPRFESMMRAFLMSLQKSDTCQDPYAMITKTPGDPSHEFRRAKKLINTELKEIPIDLNWLFVVTFCHVDKVEYRKRMEQRKKIKIFD